VEVAIGMEEVEEEKKWIEKKGKGSVNF
jgi:hypothetical protein